MLEFLRHQTKPIMITLAVIIIIAFTFWGGYTQPDQYRLASPGDTVLTVSGREVTRGEVDRLQRLFRIAEDLELPGVNSYFVSELIRLQFNHRSAETGMPLAYEGAPVDFAINLIILREAMEKYGVRASDEEVRQAFRGLGRFQVNGQLDPDRVRDFESGLGSLGFQLSDVYQIVRDSLGFQRLQQIVAGNLAADPKFANEIYTSLHQTIKAASITFTLESFKKDAKVTDEEIGKYFEENKDRYKTAEKRAVSYVFLPQPDTEGKDAEDTVKLRNAFNEKLGAISLAMIAPEADFTAEAKKAALEIKTLPAFSSDAPPEAIKDEDALVSAIFRNVPATHRVSDPVEGAKGYFIFTVTKIEPPQPKTLADAKDAIKDLLAERKAVEAMQKAANDARKNLTDTLKGGKKFADAAKEASLTVKELPDFSPISPPADLPGSREASFEVRNVPAGGFTKPINTADGIVILHVLAKELRKSPDSATGRATMVTDVDLGTRADLFRAWFSRRYQDAAIDAASLVRQAMSYR